MFAAGCDAQLRMVRCGSYRRSIFPAANCMKPASNEDIIFVGTPSGSNSLFPGRLNPMSIKTKAAIVVSSAAVLLFMVVGGLDGVRASNNDGSYRQLQVYSEVLSRVRSEYVEEPNIPAVTEGALHGLLESLDSNSSYLTASEFKEDKANQTEAKGEIGAAVSKRFGYAAVISVIPGGPADKAGIQASDIFEAIEGKSTREMSLAEIHNLLHGQPGSNLNVSVVRARRAEPTKMVITRDIVTVPPVADKMVDDAIGYIQVDAFNKGKAQEVAGKGCGAPKRRGQKENTPTPLPP